jgi:hypothetical protein
MKRSLESPERTNHLAERLARLDKVRQYDKGEYREGEVLAHTLAELEESFSRFLEIHLPRLLEEDRTDEQLWEILHDIGEEFRHILYHIKDPMYFRYLPDRKDLGEYEE